MDCTWKYYTTQHSPLTEWIQFMHDDRAHKHNGSHRSQKHIILHIRENPIWHWNPSTAAPYHMGDENHDRAGYLLFVLSPWNICAELISAVLVNQATDIVAVSVPLPLGGAAGWCLLLPDPLGQRGSPPASQRPHTYACNVGLAHRYTFHVIVIGDLWNSKYNL